MSLRNVFPTSAPAADIAAAVEQDGYAVVHDLLDEPLRDRLCHELQPHLDNTSCGSEDFWGHRTKRFGGLLAKSPAAQAMLINPTVLGVADKTLLPYCASYWVNYTGVMHLGAGESAQTLHRDTNLWPFTNPSPPLTLATMWAVSDFTAANGATLIVPGSHRWDDTREPTPDEIIAAEMPAGSVLLYTGNMIHGGGANRSNNARYGVALHYILGWLRQEETQLLTMSTDQARELPEAVQRLIGYSLGASSLGMVDHTDPYTLLTGIKNDGPKALSTPALDAAEQNIRRFTVTALQPGQRTYFDVTPDDN